MRILPDEPTGALDSRTGQELLSVLRRSVDGYGQTVVMVTHDPRAAAVADRVVFLNDGRIADEMRFPSADDVLDPHEETGGPVMFTQALRGLGANKLRTALTALAIALSVGLVSGTFVMGDTISKTFSDVFSSATAGTDARVQSSSFSYDDDDPARVPASLAEKVIKVDGVAAAEPVIQRWGVAILDRDNNRFGGNGPPQFGWSWSENDSINITDLRDGRGPVAADEVVIDVTSADAGGYTVGDAVRIAAFGPGRQGIHLGRHRRLWRGRQSCVGDNRRVFAAALPRDPRHGISSVVHRRRGRR